MFWFVWTSCKLLFANSALSAFWLAEKFALQPELTNYCSEETSDSWSIYSLSKPRTNRNSRIELELGYTDSTVG